MTQADIPHLDSTPTSTYKTVFGLKEANAFLANHLGIADPKVKMIVGGEGSQVFFFESTQGSRVLKVNKHFRKGYDKEKFAYQHFASDLIPIPQVFEVGEIKEGLFFTITEHVNGVTLDNLTSDEVTAMMPNIIKTLDAIHALTPVGPSYGKWDLSGKGEFDTWRDELMMSIDQDSEDDMKAPFYDKKLRDSLYAEIMQVVDVCPEDRAVIHYDYGFNNLLVNNNKVVGVIDWEQGAYGDPLHDIAWLDFWGEKQGYAKAFKAFYENGGRLTENYDKRIICYKLIIGISSLGFFAKSRQKEAYEDTRKIIGRIDRW